MIYQEFNLVPDLSVVDNLLLGHEPADRDGPGLLNAAYVAEVCGQDWGFYTTLTDNLAKTQALLDGILPDADQREVVGDRTGKLLGRTLNALAALVDLALQLGHTALAGAVRPD